MAISVDPATFVISVPKADLTLIQSVPTEIREMDLNWFRLALKAWEDDEGGIVFLKTHTHNTEVTLGSLTFARVIEMLVPYTVTFEDGQYAVDLTGANSNVGDVTNVNQVSVRSYNSAGLISSPAIEYSSFNGGVIIDVNSGISGTVFPRGTEQMPVDNMADALLIAEYRGFSKIYLHSDITINSGSDLDYFVLEGQSHVHTDVVIQDSANVTGATFTNCNISGILDGQNEISGCIIGSLDYVNGHIHSCGLTGELLLDGSEDAVIDDCVTVDAFSIPSINMGGSGQNLAMPNYSGLLNIRNMTGANFIGVGLNSGAIVLESTITSGTVHISGTGMLEDESGDPIQSGTWNGGVTIINTLMNTDNIEASIWDADLADHAIADTFGGEFTRVTDISTEVWGSDLADFDVEGTFGFAFRELRGLQQHNFRLRDQVYQQINLGNNNFKYVLTDGTIRLYNNAIDAAADTNHFASYTIAASYDGNGNCTAYSVVLD